MERVGCINSTSAPEFWVEDLPPPPLLSKAQLKKTFSQVNESSDIIIAKTQHLLSRWQKENGEVSFSDIFCDILVADGNRKILATSFLS